MAHRERPFCTERTARAIARVGQGVNLAIERFVTVGETIADDNPEIKADMYLECKEARAAGEYTHILCIYIYIYTHRMNTVAQANGWGTRRVNVNGGRGAYIGASLRDII